LNNFTQFGLAMCFSQSLDLLDLTGELQLLLFQALEREKLL